MDEERQRRVDCFRCRHFYITWDRSFPRGCRVLEFRSRELPCLVVLNTSGIECQMFSPKKRSQRTGQ